MLMRVLIVLSIIFLMSAESQAQFWFGPKAGIQMNNHAYQDKTYRKQYDINPDLNWHAGFALQYTTDRSFAVHTELIYQQIRNSVGNTPEGLELESKSTYSFLSVPMLGRATLFSAGPVSFFAVAGPRLSFWLNGSGNYYTKEGDDNFGVGGGSYNVSFSESVDGVGDGILTVRKSNRLQFALDFGVGTLLDLASGQRVAVELRYSKGHSNMALDSFPLQEGVSYEENLQYANNQILVSAALLFGYNPTDRRKGSSTNKLSNKKKK